MSDKSTFAIKEAGAYKNTVILPEIEARLAIEMASPKGWDHYVGDAGDILAIDHFGASAPGQW
jgi:transketolase